MSLLPHQGSLDACLRSVAGRRTFTKPAAKSPSCPVDLEMKVVHPTSSFTLNPRSYCLTSLGRVCADGVSEFDVTKTMRAWRKANAYIRSGQHEKAVYWLPRTVAILEGERPRRRRLDGMDTGYMFGALGILVLLWVVKG